MIEEAQQVNIYTISGFCYIGKNQLVLSLLSLLAAILDFSMTAKLVLFVHLVLHMHFNSLVVPLYSCRHRFYLIHFSCLWSLQLMPPSWFLLALSNFSHQLLILCLFLFDYIHIYIILYSALLAQACALYLHLLPGWAVNTEFSEFDWLISGLYRAVRTAVNSKDLKMANLRW